MNTKQKLFIRLWCSSQCCEAPCRILCENYVRCVSMCRILIMIGSDWIRGSHETSRNIFGKLETGPVPRIAFSLPRLSTVTFARIPSSLRSPKETPRDKVKIYFWYHGYPCQVILKIHSASLARLLLRVNALWGTLLALVNSSLPQTQWEIRTPRHNSEWDRAFPIKFMIHHSRNHTFWAPPRFTGNGTISSLNFPASADANESVLDLQVENIISVESCGGIYSETTSQTDWNWKSSDSGPPSSQSKMSLPL